MDKETIKRNIEHISENVDYDDVIFYLGNDVVTHQITQVIVARDTEDTKDEIAKVVKTFALYFAEQPHMIDVFEGAIKLAKAARIFHSNMN